MAPSPIHGLGFFTSGFLSSEDVIPLRTRHRLGVLPASETDEDDQDHYVQCPHHTICLCVLACDAGRFTNHSFYPNCELRWIRRSLQLWPLRTLEPRTELTLDYGTSYRFVRDRLRDLRLAGLPFPPQYAAYQVQDVL